MVLHLSSSSSSGYGLTIILHGMVQIISPASIASLTYMPRGPSPSFPLRSWTLSLMYPPSVDRTQSTSSWLRRSCNASKSSTCSDATPLVCAVHSATSVATAGAAAVTKSREQTATTMTCLGGLDRATCSALLRLDCDCVLSVIFGRSEGTNNASTCCRL